MNLAEPDEVKAEVIRVEERLRPKSRREKAVRDCREEEERCGEAVASTAVPTGSRKKTEELWREVSGWGIKSRGSKAQPGKRAGPGTTEKSPKPTGHW